MRTILLRMALALALALSLFPPPAARADQGSACMPTTGTVSGLAFAQAVNLGFAAVISTNSGATAPATGCAGVAVKGQWWLDTSATPNIVKFYDGTNWLAVASVDLTNHVWVPPVGGGTATLASASTVDLGAAPASAVTISGTTTITSLGSSAVAGSAKFIRFSGALTLTHNATSLILPTGADIATVAGDTAIAIALGGGNWSLWGYSRATGLPVANQAVPVGTVLDYVGFNLPDSNYEFTLGQCLTRASYPLVAPALGKAQQGSRSSGGTTITGIADTSMFGLGMQVEGTGIQAGSTISSFTSSTITLSLQALSTGTADVIVYPASPCSSPATEIRLPDLRGRVAAGRDNMGGTAAGRMTSGGGGITGTALGNAGGSETGTLSIAQLPTVTPSGSVVTSISGSVTIYDPGHAHGVNASGSNTAVSTSPQNATTPLAANNNTSTAYTGITAAFSGAASSAFFGNSFGSGNAHSRMQPTAVVNKIMRVR
ncbi:hypothetical protein [Bosea sp. FBZP-16]|uniref:hypothetical protein n=1 Tax=Bosea sp. FBZP-16 TaxID=2065382 RepID=UPI000C309F9C|nr:hypothetical protein [Bosea sp. FBZP-16]